MLHMSIDLHDFYGCSDCDIRPVLLHLPHSLSKPSWVWNGHYDRSQNEGDCQSVLRSSDDGSPLRSDDFWSQYLRQPREDRSA